MSVTYLTTVQLAARIHYDVRSIRNRLKDSVLLEGRHYLRAFGQRKLLWIWEEVEAEMIRLSSASAQLPMARGRVASNG